MLSAEFEPAIWSDEIICEIQDGVIKRKTKNETLVERAQFEICNHKFSTIINDGYAFTLVNDSKYGLRAKDGKLSLNLLRSPTFPDESADKCEHEFIYSILPHRDNELINSVRSAHNLNRLPLVYRADYAMERLVKLSNSSLVCDCIKVSEDKKEGIVVRIYEPCGNSVTTSLAVYFSYKRVFECILIEGNRKDVDLNKLSFSPCEIKTLYFEI
ncbi:hypothetical protein FYJ80_09260 [Spirochaetales bacterium NM-380-WT-3C1]|uniref:Alpha-mannosidase n=2 Tax=Bullifex porci TaxID=2606638 RepID=A0A7X2PDN2_9SPIO|nr:hypothetical protein [Bullifex porci]